MPNIFHRVRKVDTPSPQIPAIQIKNQSRPYIPGSSVWARFRPLAASVVKLIHRVLGNETPVTRLADRAISVVSDLSPMQKIRLQNWVDEAETDTDISHRTEAAEAILQCARETATSLNLMDLNLTSLPDVLGELRQIKTLKVGNNKLEHLPETLSGLRNLRYFACNNCGLREVPEWISAWSNINYLNLSNNELDQLPQSFGRLKSLGNVKLVDNQFKSPPDILKRLGGKKTCQVLLRNNLIPKHEENMWGDERGQGQLYVYTTPRISFEDAEKAELNPLVSHWFNVAGESLTTEIIEKINNITDQQKDTLRIHLYKLVGTQDYRDPVRGQDMAGRMVQVLKAMAEDDDVMEDCLAASYEATSSCIDRALLGLNSMEQAVLVAKARRAENPAELITLGSGLWRKHLVKEIADDEFKKQQGIKQLVTWHEGDQVEIELAYMLGLSERLDLPLAKDQAMWNREYSEVTDKMLDSAHRNISKELAEHPEKEERYLLSWTPLQEKLADIYYGDIDDINDEFLEEIGKLDLNDSNYALSMKSLERERETAVNVFLLKAINSIKNKTPLPYHIKSDVLRIQQEEIAVAMAAVKRNTSG